MKAFLKKQNPDQKPKHEVVLLVIRCNERINVLKNGEKFNWARLNSCIIWFGFQVHSKKWGAWADNAFEIPKKGSFNRFINSFEILVEHKDEAATYLDNLAKEFGVKSYYKSVYEGESYMTDNLKPYWAEQPFVVGYFNYDN